MNASSRETKSLVIASSLPESLAQKVQVPGRSPPCRQRHLPVESRERHCPVMGLYSWLSSAHTHRKDPSTFSQKASPHTPLSSSHSFTSGKGSTDQVRCVPHAWPRFVSPAVPWLVVSAGTRGRPPPREPSNPSALGGKGLYWQCCKLWFVGRDKENTTQGLQTPTPVLRKNSKLYFKHHMYTLFNFHFPDFFDIMRS